MMYIFFKFISRFEPEMNSKKLELMLSYLFGHCRDLFVMKDEPPYLNHEMLTSEKVPLLNLF